MKAQVLILSIFNVFTYVFTLAGFSIDIFNVFTYKCIYPSQILYRIGWFPFLKDKRNEEN